ncbi:MAG TPA: HD domain-containing phosphohydrolase [Chloroflexia bacterium]|nr:HD domain-containing phosphohydrolase [Chloroflexia bacterium]
MLCDIELSAVAKVYISLPTHDIPYCHHEKWDGSGYTRGLRDVQIPLVAWIFAVVDVWDALNTTRLNRDSWPRSQVREQVRSLAGAHRDREVVARFWHWTS